MTETRDVVIVGAGPTGLALAVELALAGIAVTVLERLAAPDPTIKAGSLGALAGEALERRGLQPAILAEERMTAAAMAAMAAHSAAVGGGAAMPAVSLARIGGHFAGLFLIDQTRQREPARRLRGIRQQTLEVALGARAAELGVDVRRGCELTSFDDAGDAVELAVHGPAGAFAMRAAYLVGCDGGRSAVRKRAGFEFVGTEPTITGHQAMVTLDHPERLLPLGWRRTPVGMMAYGPVPGRIFMVEFDGPPADRDSAVTLDEVQRSLRRVSGADVTITAMASATRFTDNARQATSYQRGRVLLAGDAAHVHSPFGGQGLNLGVLDAVNLGWKLARTIRGTAPPELLASYTHERHPVAARVLANTRAQVALMRPDPLTTALRDIVTEVLALDAGQHYFGDLMNGVQTRYDLGDPHPLVGRHAADRALDGGTLYDAMQNGGGVLVDAGDGAASARTSGRVHAVRAAGDASWLVRPDGVVAWAREPGDLAGLDDAVARWF